MMQVNVSISNEILDWIMAHIRLDSLPSQIAKYLETWRSGEKKPTYNQIEKTSKATGIPLGYFFLQSPPTEDLSLVEYRTVDSLELSNPSRNLIDTMHDMDLIQEWTHNHLLDEGAAPLDFVGAQKAQGNISDFAMYIRQLLHLNVEWFKQSQNAADSFRIIRSAISNAGVVVMTSGIVENNTHRILETSEFRAFTIVDNYAPLIFINSNDSWNGKLFSLLHELAHVCIGENSLFNDRYTEGTAVKKAETICNAVAAEIIVPQDFFTTEWKHLWKDMSCDQVINVMSRNFKCGITVIARKALDNGYIDFPTYKKYAQLAVKQYNDSRKNNTSSGGNYYRTAASRIDQRFFGMLLDSVATGKTLYSDAFRMTNTNRTTFSILAEHVGGGIR